MANKGTVEVLIKLKDQASKQLEKVNKSFKKTKLEVDKTGKEFKSLGTDAKKGLNGVEKAAKKTTTSMNGLSRATKATSQSSGILNTANITLAAGLYALARATRLVISTFAEFDDTMRAVGAVSNATDKQLAELTNTARNMGATTRFTATQAADGLRFLAMAGFSVEQAIGALPGVLQLASAGALDLGQAADIATNILTGFGKSVNELGTVNDVLVTTFTSTNTNLVELGEAFKLVAPVAAAVGTDFNDLAASLGLLANAGLKGTLAGTSLRGAINALLNPTKEEAEFMRELGERIGGVGLKVRDAEGNFIGFLDIVKQLEKANIKGDEALKLFGLRAGPGIAALVNQGSAALETLTGKLDESGGTAARIAKQMEAGLGGSLRVLKSAMTELVLVLGDDLTPALTAVIKSMTGLVRAVVKADTVTKALIGTLSAGVFAWGAWTLGIKKLVVSLAALRTSMNMAQASSMSLTANLKSGLVVSAVFAAYEIGRLTVALFKLYKATEEQKRVIGGIIDDYGDLSDSLDFQIEKVEDLKKLNAEQLDEYKEGLKLALKAQDQLLASKRLEGKATAEVKLEIAKLRKAADELFKILFPETVKATNATKSLAQSAKELGDAYKKSFADTVQASSEYYNRQITQTKEAAAIGIITKQEEARQIIAIEALKFDDMFRVAQEYAEKAKELDDNSVANHAKAIELMKTAVAGLEQARINALQRVKSAQDEFNAAQLQSASLTNDLIQTITDATLAELEGKDKIKALDEINKKDLKEIRKLKKSGSKEDLDAAEALIKKVSERNKQIMATAKAEADSDKDRRKAQKEFVKDQEKLIGISKEIGSERVKAAADALAKEKELAAAFTDNIEKARTELDTLVNQERMVSIDVEIDKQSLSATQAVFDEIERDILIKKIKFEVVGGLPDDQIAGERKGVAGYATGGSVHGAGGIDNVPAWLTAGEFVLKKSTVEKLGLPFLTALNGMNIDGLMGNIRTNFATGGLVGGASPLGQLSFAKLMRFASGGSTEALAAEKGRISRAYDEQIAEAKLRGDEDKVFALKEEKIALRELADELKKQLEELEKQFTEQLDEQKANLKSLKEMQKKYAPFGHSTSITTGTGTAFRPILGKSAEQVRAEIPVVESNIVDLTAQNDANIKAIKKSNDIKVDEVKLNTQQTLTDIDRRTQDAIRRLEEERFDALSGVGMNSISGRSGGLRRQFFAEGGSVHGEGGTDNVPAFLTSGEYVLRKSVVEGLGKPFLDSLNNFRIPVPRFAEGGSVGSVASRVPAGKNFGTLQLAIGNKSFSIQGEESELSGLVQTLKEAGQRL